MPTSAPSRQEFTPSMRDRQARGKNPAKESASSDEHEDESVILGRGIKAEPFEDRERRGFALSVLDCPEQLIMYALSTGDSIAGQRFRFTAMLCGFEDRSAGKGKRVGGTGR
ncbi:hypothetical protein C2857_004252 [Epichloe festucae Fl1]|uniref:Uncharacterized protein n=1 Tax=Epichloe festucae (strain Fl1) TaxID=877507 RepID=A0A7S9KUZ0_EPIFF|nr:hypothetical protein C2857_004252 [Epichloe festucae Fl1]